MLEERFRYRSIREVEDYYSPQIIPLVTAIVEMMKDAFGRSDFPEESIKDHIKGDMVILAEILGIVKGTTVEVVQEVVGYSSLQFGSMRELVGIDRSGKGAYLAAAVVHSNYQGKGVYGELTRRRIEESLRRGVKTIFTRTQNPRVEKGIRGSLEKMGVNYELERVLVPGVYGQQLTAERPKVRDRRIQRAYDKLNYPSGDAYVLVFRNLRRK